MKQVPSLIFFVVLVVGGGVLIGALTPPDAWYAALEKPPFNPPGWVFGPTWTVLYVMIAIAGWRIRTTEAQRRSHRASEGSPSGGMAMKIWWGQLGLNFAWSPVFFGLHRSDVALAIIIALFLAIVAFIAAARHVDRPAALLFVPYAIWVAFAALLNASIFALNS